MASEELNYLEVLALLAAGRQAECIVDLELGHVVLMHIRLVFLKALLISLEKIDS